MQDSPSNRQFSTLRGPFGNKVQLPSAIPNNSFTTQTRQAALASAGSRNSIILSNRQILLEKMSHMSNRFPAGVVVDSNFAGYEHLGFHVGGK